MLKIELLITTSYTADHSLLFFFSSLSRCFGGSLVEWEQELPFPLLSWGEGTWQWKGYVCSGVHWNVKRELLGTVLRTEEK